MKIQNIRLDKLKPNAGQIEGLPKNPRFIKDDKFAKLVKSIEDDPEMMSLRELIVYPLNDEFIIICGNMRYRAMKQIGYKEAPCKVLTIETPVEKLRAYAIKDNVPFGADDWDLLANEWSEIELKEWGMDVPVYEDEKVKEDISINRPFNNNQILIEYPLNLHDIVKPLIDKIKMIEGVIVELNCK